MLTAVLKLIVKQIVQRRLRQRYLAKKQKRTRKRLLFLRKLILKIRRIRRMDVPRRRPSRFLRIVLSALLKRRNTRGMDRLKPMQRMQRARPLPIGRRYTMKAVKDRRRWA